MREKNAAARMFVNVSHRLCNTGNALLPHDAKRKTSNCLMVMNNLDRDVVYEMQQVACCIRHRDSKL